MAKDRSRMAKILVVDDDDFFRSFLEELLGRTGYEVVSAPDGTRGIELAIKEIPDLIILDVMMPDMSGGVTAHHLSENNATRDIPIIFLTSIISEEQEMMVDNKESSYQFLAKPIRAERLLEEVEKALQGMPE
jgi:CheY-like chemotaxis protein